jgi:hypothetical protein
MDTMKYQALLNILDEICSEAPIEYRTYKARASDTEKLNQARSKAFIHLYLKVKFGLVEFKERHSYITDGANDGGLDAYYIDSDNKKLYLIQSKFRPTPENFAKKTVSAEELVKMEVNRIIKGELNDTNGVQYNSKIESFQKKWSGIRDQANYENIVIILGNLGKYNDQQMRKLVDNSKYEIFNYAKTYSDLVFPLCAGTYYDPKEIEITINLRGKKEPKLQQEISTKGGKYNVAIIFVPTYEIARIMSKYKNSILRYNPRNYLGLARNKVNRKIETSLKGSGTNEFAILNNGITVIADSCKYTSTTGKTDTGQLILKRPEIINGGQTAYVLSDIFEKSASHHQYFENKEVLLKILIIQGHDLQLNPFIEEISDATNQQTQVDEADRRSNDEIQIILQQLLFGSYGLFYERKKGEFHSGLVSSYLDKKSVISRSRLIRSYLALTGDPSQARSASEDKLFETDKFKKILGNTNQFRDMLFAYLVLGHLRKITRSQSKIWGSGLRYGKMAIIAAIGAIGYKQKQILSEITNEAVTAVNKIKNQWNKFEKWVAKQKHNKEYLENNTLNFDNYYKGPNVKRDIKNYF